MRTKKIKTISRTGWIILAAVIISLSGCATKKAAWGSLKKGIVMQYQLHPDKDLIYSNTSSFEQVMQVMEQEFTITAESEQLMKMMPITDKDHKLTYEVSMEALSAVINTPRGEMVAKPEDVLGKSFKLTISPLGKELEYSGAEALVYDYGSGDTKSLSSDVQAFFPDLPDHPVRIGDSWKSQDKIIEKTSSGKLLMSFDNVNTFEKIETVDGYECMKINVEYSGTLEGEGEQENMEMITTGTIAGTSTWYFAFKEGIYVSQTNVGTGNTVTEITGGPQEMSLPATREITMKTVLVAK